LRSQVGTSWSTPIITGGPTLQRFGQRYVAWGAVLYAFGGVNAADRLDMDWHTGFIQVLRAHVCEQRFGRHRGNAG
jgi:hypothetical protein